MRKNPFVVRVAIVDDHQLVCAAIAELLRQNGRFSVAAQAYTATEAEALIRRKDLDVLLLDLEMPELHGLKLLEKVNGLPVCVLTMHTDLHFIRESINAGALGYVTKQTVAEELVQALLAVSEGEPFFSSDIRSAALAQSFRNEQRLSPREQEVLRLSAQGASNGEVAEQLRISRRTAEAHRASLLKKLALRSQTDLVRYALRNNLVAV